jgi:hypothetical protein
MPADDLDLDALGRREARTYFTYDTVKDDDALDGYTWAKPTSGVLATQAEWDALVARARLALDLRDVSRVEIISETGRVYSRWNTRIASVSQDDGRTLKLFTEER